MIPGIENMSAEQLRKMILEKQDQLTSLEQTNRIITKDKHILGERISILTRANEKLAEENKTWITEIKNLEQKTRFLEVERNRIEKKFKELLEEFCSMKFELSQLKRLVFGSKRERFVSNQENGQMSLPFEMVQQSVETEPVIEKVEYTRRKANNENHNGRLPLPDHLPVEEIIIEPEEDTTQLKCIGKEITDELEYIPSVLKIKRYIRPKYAKANDEGIVIGNLPTRPIDKCIAGAGLLAQIHVDKFVDHLPFYRQAQRYEREGVKIPRSTIDNWQTGTANLLWPLYNELKRQVLGQGYIQLDETPIRVLDQRKKGKCHRGYHWVYHAPIEHMVFFDYQEGRSRDGPKRLLMDFKGYLQTDGYNVYEWFGIQKDITLVNCMAHARRMFEKALSDDRKRAGYVMEEIQKLYYVEQQARERGFSAEERHELRLDESLPVLNELGAWMAEQVRTTIPKSPFGKALIYSISRWDNLMTYLKDGYLEIDNNLVENAIRPNALGRKNYLFAGSHAGAQRAAMFYSFFGTCKMNSVNPFKWLKTVLEIIPDYPANKIADLLPQNLDLHR